MNNYKKSIKIINNSWFSVKGLKTFIGREGHGVNANLYYKGKKVAFLLDSGNGGCLDIDWESVSKNVGIRVQGVGYLRGWNNPEIVKEAQQYLQTLIQSLPKTTWKDVFEGTNKDYGSDGEYRWYDENVINEIIDFHLRIKDYKKMLKGICVFSKDKKEVVFYKEKSKNLSTIYNTEKGKMSGREYFSQHGIILNDLSQSECFEYFEKYR